jgi:uncharacterized protein (UPF0332 family)
MTHAKNKVEWCEKKAQKELKETGTHRGLLKIRPDIQKAKAHIKKAEHYLQATTYLKKGDFSDISATTVFYCMYHCLLSICVKFGYDSRNQECTFALIESLIEDGKIDFDKDIIEKIASITPKEPTEKKVVKIREKYQYDITLSIGNDLYNELVDLAKEVLDKTRSVVMG